MTLLVPQSAGIPLPRPTPVTKPFWDACAEGRLAFQRCTACSTPVFNPATLCPRCHSSALAWEDSAGLGAIYSWTVAHRPLSPAFTPIYVPIIVDLDEGYQMVSNLIGCEDTDAAVGLRVKVEFHLVDTITLPYFRPA